MVKSSKGYLVYTMLIQVGLGILGLYVAVILTVLVFKLKNVFTSVNKLENTISEKLKTKQEIIDDMPVIEAKKKYVRFRAEVLSLIQDAEPYLTRAIAKALGGDKSSAKKYREGGM